MSVILTSPLTRSVKWGTKKGKVSQSHKLMVKESGFKTRHFDSMPELSISIVHQLKFKYDLKFKSHI